jgi:hypothetical protein
MSEVATHTSPTAEEQELEDLLGSHRGRQENPVDDIDINAPLNVDASEVEFAREKWPAGTYPVRSTGLRLTKSGTPPYNLMTVVTFTCLAGPLKGQTRNEFLMLGGKGLVKTCYFLNAVGLYDHTNKKILFKIPAEMLDKDCWIVIEWVKQTSKRNTEFIADAVPFQEGFLSFLDDSGKPRFEMPDIFSEPGQVEKPSASASASAAAPKPSAAPAATPPVVSASAAPAPNWNG